MSVAERHLDNQASSAALRLHQPDYVRTTSRFTGLILLARPHQWIKNVFLLIPVVLSPELISVSLVLQAVAAASLFCVLSSAVYVINDLSDREADRLHPVKRGRPLAAGIVQPHEALLLAIGLVLIALPAAWQLGWAVASVCAIYLTMNLAYTFHFKHKPIIDVLIVAMCYVLRVYAGSYAIGIEPTIWLVNCTGFLALFIALAKRRDDVVKSLSSSHRTSLAGYNQTFLDGAIAITLGTLVVLYCVYTASPEVTARYQTDQLFMTIPFVVAGVLRYLQATIIEERSGEPTRFVLTDRFLLLSVMGWTATFLAIIYNVI